MPTSVNVTNLKINELTEAQYDSAVQGGVIGANELSILTDAEAGQVIQVTTLPTASADELGNIYQFVGTTDANYTHGYFYECVSDGQQPATYSWTNVEVQPSSGGLPTQTGNAGKFLTTDGTDASWGNALVNYGFGNGSNSGLWISNVYSNPGGTVGLRSIALGGGRATATHAIQIGGSYKVNGNYFTAENNVASTMKVAVENGNFEMMSADGTIPTDRLTKVNSTITLAAAGWSSNTQTVNVTGMTATGVVMVSPDPTDQSAYTSAGILCTAQGTDSLTFTAKSTPSSDIDVNIVCL